MQAVGMMKNELDTPVLWVDLDILEKNIEQLANFFSNANINWRPHTKGIKVPAIAHKAITAGAIGITCAKLGEAEVMAASGIQDILIANQIVGHKKITRLVNLRQHVDVKVAVDNEKNVLEIGQAARGKGVQVGVLVEVNLGMDRSGVQPGNAALELASLVNQTEGLQLRGLMGWEGHTTAIEDPEERRKAINVAIKKLTDSTELCRNAGLPIDIVSCGGSITANVTSFIPGLTESQTGGAMFCDVLYKSRGVSTENALYVRSTVTSRPAPDIITLDAGFKALPAWLIQPRPVGVTGIKSFRTSAEHGKIILQAPNYEIDVGDVLDVIVSYGDYTVFLYDYLYGLRSGGVEVVWKIEGRGKLQ